MKYFFLIITFVLLIASCTRTNKKSTPNFNDNQDTLKHEVLGFFDSSIDLKNSLDYSVLSTLAYFSYEVDPETGDSKSISKWKSDRIIDIAKKKEVKILLTVTLMGRENNRTFLNNNSAQNQLIKNLKLLLQNRGDGICIDFEGVGRTERSNLTKFIKKAQASLKSENSKYQIYLAIPGVDAGYLDFDALIPNIDQFVIMGYDFNSAHGNSITGSTAPLMVTSKFPPYSLSKSVDTYLEKNIPSSKLILALPYYGLEWKTHSSEKYAEGEFIETIRYDHIIERKTPQDILKYDTISQSAWFAKPSSNDKESTFKQYWFDNDSTLSIKLRYIRDKKLNGVGIWKLGYALDQPQRWQMISKNLSLKKPNTKKQ